MSGVFAELMSEAMVGAERFGHREHVKVTWLAVRRLGVERAVGVVSEGIQQTARYAGAPQKYHATVSRAWVELVGHHAFEADEFDQVVARNPGLLDKRLLMRFYRPSTLASSDARAGWVEPDLVGFPWTVGERPEGVRGRV
ncbi:hypothetical protein [Allorhizocola rhizosphaerae]|uniref:hypothetical protein n=1 Tax=Allorhizocola rhizosphaerae TaxID=1872709 RepID=UPI001FEBD027|nr:hypothetical protein [Allorhizocola rhizosphaerae]